jgi:hypothetical protein
MTEDEQHKIAGAIVEHLEQSNWKIAYLSAAAASGRGCTLLPSTRLTRGLRTT